MTKSKCGGLARLPNDQKIHFLIGPTQSWFVPNNTDLWTQPTRSQAVDSNTGAQSVIMDCDTRLTENSQQLSYFVYGSKRGPGCFCYGQIYHRLHGNRQSSLSGDKVIERSLDQSQHKISAIVKKLIDIKDDNSRVVCVRFLKASPLPFVVVLTESGSLLIHDCIREENLVHFNKTELLSKFLGLSGIEGSLKEPCAKRPKLNVAQQLNSCCWPRPDTILFGVSLPRDKTCFVSRLKIGDILSSRTSVDLTNKNEFVLEHHRIDLEIENNSSPICIIESSMLDDNICVIAVGLDDGMIIVVVLDLNTNKKLRTIRLARHNDQICSISLHLSNTKKFPLGLLASVARDGLVLIWDIENEFYFADYLTVQGVDRGPGAKINWFSLRFITIERFKRTYLAVSNAESDITLLEIPEKAKSKIRLKTYSRAKPNRTNMAEQTIKHNALIFQIVYDPLSETIITSSLDGNHILWSVDDATTNGVLPISVTPQFLSTSMNNEARTHMLRYNPIREDLMCSALGKGGVRFYSISENLIDSRFDMTPSCAAVSRKLVKACVKPTSIAWHPNHEYRLAIGTIEGKVYRADITPRKPALLEAQLQQSASSGLASADASMIDDAFGVDYTPIMREEEATQCKSKNAKTKTDGIYSLCWGPNPTSPQDLAKHAIYAVGSVSHKLLIYYSNKDNADKLTNYLDEFRDKSLPEASDQASEVAWKSSMDLMALGTTDGRVIIATYLDECHQERSNNRLFKILTTINGPFGDNFVQCLAWHPTTDPDDSNYYKIVVSSHESAAFVFNLKEAILVADVRERLKLEQSDGDTVNMNLFSAYVNKLDAHQKSISDMAWHPHEPNQLATCSFDRTCLVWSLDNSLMDAQIIAKFSARDRLFTLEWSLVDTNLIYTSGNDSIIWAWRPSENRVRHHEIGST